MPMARVTRVPVERRGDGASLGCSSVLAGSIVVISCPSFVRWVMAVWRLLAARVVDRLLVDQWAERQRSADTACDSKHCQQADPLPTF